MCVYIVLCIYCFFFLLQIAKYCNESKYYIPRNKELCLALFENGWYRAICICRNETHSTSTVFFIDYGNIESINHKDIRFMPKDFINPNACACICKIVSKYNTYCDKCFILNIGYYNL